MRLFQFVWWGWSTCETCWAFDPAVIARVRFIRDTNGMAHIYRWRLVLGPLEIRRWVRS